MEVEIVRVGLGNEVRNAEGGERDEHLQCERERVRVRTHTHTPQPHTHTHTHTHLAEEEHGGGDDVDGRHAHDVAHQQHEPAERCLAEPVPAPSLSSSPPANHPGRYRQRSP